MSTKTFNFSIDIASQEKTRHDGSQGNKSGCNRAEPKPLPKFVTDCPWIDGMLVTRYI